MTFLSSLVSGIFYQPPQERLFSITAKVMVFPGVLDSVSSFPFQD